jgi:RES domain-containing protein
MILWRISNYADLTGRGGLLATGRWHDQGNPIVYCTDHPSTALLEVLVHVDPDQLPDGFQLLKIYCADDVGITTIRPGEIDFHDGATTKAAGAQWLGERSTLFLQVPSAVMPEASNILVNPLHADAVDLKIESARRYVLDRRLLG